MKICLEISRSKISDLKDLLYINNVIDCLAFMLASLSLLPFFLVVDEMAKHVEGSVRLVGRHQVTSSIHQHEP